MASELPRKILIFGATGLIGKYIIQEIVSAQPPFEKIGLFTSPATVEKKAEEIQGWREKGVEVVVGDVNDEGDVRDAYKSYDTVISALGRNAILTQIPLLRLAAQSPSIRYFYPSEYGTDIEYSPASASEPPHQLKLQVRAYIREQVQDLSVTYLVTGPYSDLYFAPSGAGAGSFDPKARRATLLGTGEEKVSFTTMRDVGRLLVAALRMRAHGAERVLKVNSFTATGRQAVAEFEAQTGGAWEVDYVGLEELRAREKRAWEEDKPTKTVFTLRRIWIEGGTLYERRDNGEVGLEEGLETLADQVRDVIARYG
ncbi:hypothetical protein C7974DRAFT_306960 [Boeremia exigua]|uniref:uncharacterized protein n=1 Tax=Boeremia exigua TaxID=749465 RepID=UPI001E8E44E7|nr:uncharacterized protein C7974DRAFT_306960 [Boeremia exigua]KAH6637775.1 hypothetical protein C7974DRAFT_306960 [Boeremia exigua]